MKENRKYLVSDGDGRVYALTPYKISQSNDKGAGFRDKEGRAYLEDQSPCDLKLYEEGR